MFTNPKTKDCENCTHKVDNRDDDDDDGGDGRGAIAKQYVVIN